MKNLEESYLLKEAARISNELISEKGVTNTTSANDDWPKVTLAKEATNDPEGDGFDAQTANKIPSSEEAEPPVVYREEQLKNILINMCEQGGFNGAVIADNNGLPLVAYNSPVKNEIIAAFTSILAMALAGVGKLLDEQDANHIAVDINNTEKVALRLFHIDDQPYYLLIICSKEIEEKAELELSIDQMMTILK